MSHAGPGTAPGALDPDWRLRLAAFAQLRLATDARGGVVSAEDLDAGFEHEGQRIRLWDARRGIWRPRQLGRDGRRSRCHAGARSLRGHRPRPLDQRCGPAGVSGASPADHLYGITPGLYEPVFPCSVVADDPANLAFHIMAETAARLVGPEMMAAGVTPERQYATAAVKVRLHQRRFRELVVSAYQVTCAMCQLRHGELLDAAHILADRDERGRPEVPNGLCLCKIHHAAYDADIVGVDPEYRVHVRRDVLEEQDGPMLQHGLQAMQDVRIQLPRSATQRPRREYLEERFGRFRAA